jgi:hypothetical protein
MGAGFNALAQAGVQSGLAQAQQRRALTEQEHNQALSDYNTKINNTQQRLSLLDKSSAEYAPLRNQLNQLVADRTQLFHPDQPGGLERLGRMLWEKVHGPIAPQTQTDVTAPDASGVLPNSASVPIPALPAVAAQPTSLPSKGQTTQPIAATQAATLPPMSGPAPELPATPGIAITHPALTPAEIKARMAQDVGFGLTNPPVNPFLQTQRMMEEAGYSPEQIQRRKDIEAGVAAKPIARVATAHWSLYKMPDGTYRNFNLNDPNGQPPPDATPATSITQPKPSGSKYAMQRETWARSHNVLPGQMTWDQERQFENEAFGASQPLAEKRLRISEMNANLNEKKYELSRTQGDMRAFLAVQKQLSPMERIQTAAGESDQYVSAPSGPGDIALTMAYVEATKPSSGFRFTDAERRWIVGARGAVDGALTRINQGYNGETLSPEQRRRMSDIIHAASTQASLQRDSLLEGVGEFNPRIVDAVKKNSPASLKSEAKKTSGGLPDAARAQLRAGHITTFGNKQQWTIGPDGQPKRVK